MRIGIIGLGSIGTRHLNNLTEMGGHKLAVYDPVLTEHAFATIESFWACEPEAVVICTPPEHHYNYAAQAIRRNIHVFIEKPIATAEGQAHMLVSLAKHHNVQLAVGYQLRFLLHKNYRQISCGKDAYFTSTQDMSQWPSQYQKDPLEEFSHEIDLAIHLYGVVDAVAMHQIDSSCIIRLRHVGAVSCIHLDWGSTIFKRDLYVDGELSWQFDKKENNFAYKQEIHSFIRACEGKGFDYRLCGGAQAGHVVKIIEACRLSDLTCSVVRLGVSA